MKIYNYNYLELVDFPNHGHGFRWLPEGIFYGRYGSHDGSPPEIHCDEVLPLLCLRALQRRNLGGNLVGGAEQFKHIKLWQSVSGDE